MGILRLRITAMKTLSEASIASQEARKRRGWAGGVFATIQPRFLREEGSTDDVEGSREGGGVGGTEAGGKDRRSSKQNKSEPKITSDVGGDGGWRVSNPRQEKRRQKGLEAAYNSGLMAGWT